MISMSGRSAHHMIRRCADDLRLRLQEAVYPREAVGEVRHEGMRGSRKDEAVSGAEEVSKGIDDEETDR
jgi:hypothetical protein